MFKFLRLSFKNLFRNKRRTAIALLVLVFGSIALLFAGGFVRFTYWGLRESTIHTDVGHLQVFNKDHFEKEEERILQYGIEDYERIKKEIYNIWNVDLVMGRIDFTGLITDGDKSTAILGSGIEPKVEDKLRSFFTEAAAYDILSPEDEDCVILGEELAISMNAEEGDYLTIMTTTQDGALNAIDCKFVGTANAPVSGLSKRLVVVNLKTAQRLLATNKVKNLVIGLDDTQNTSKVQAEIDELIKRNNWNLCTRNWHDLAEYYKKVVTLYDNMFGFIIVILFVIVVVSIIDTVMMSIFERTREIGTMLAYGTSRLTIFKIFTYEGIMLGVIGSVIGMGLALIFSYLINRAGLTMPPPPGHTGGYPLRIRNEIDMFVFVGIVNILAVFIATVIPTIKTVKMKIVDALGHI